MVDMQFVSEHLEQIIAPKERLMEHQLQVVRWTFEMVISFAKHQINCARLFFLPHLTRERCSNVPEMFATAINFWHA